MKPSLVPADAKVGIVLCTHAAVPYIHLGLEALRRNESDVKILIHDDCSRKVAELASLAAQYGAACVSTEYRKVPTVGDLSGFVEGLRWGQQQGIDIVVKCSRRFIFNKSWSAGLAELMHNTGYATATNACAWYGFGFRSEVVAMHVPSWHASGAFAEMQQAVRENRQPDPLPEAWIHHRCRDTHRFTHPADESASHASNASEPECDMLVRYENKYHRSDQWDGFAPWPVMGLSRHSRVPGILWHDSHEPQDYAALAQKFGLPYTTEDFVVIRGE